MAAEDSPRCQIGGALGPNRTNEETGIKTKVDFGAESKRLYFNSADKLCTGWLYERQLNRKYTIEVSFVDFKHIYCPF